MTRVFIPDAERAVADQAPASLFGGILEGMQLGNQLADAAARRRSMAARTAIAEDQNRRAQAKFTAGAIAGLTPAATGAATGGGVGARAGGRTRRASAPNQGVAVTEQDLSDIARELHMLEPIDRRMRDIDVLTQGGEAARDVFVRDRGRLPFADAPSPEPVQMVQQPSAQRAASLEQAVADSIAAEQARRQPVDFSDPALRASAGERLQGQPLSEEDMAAFLQLEALRDDDTDEVAPDFGARVQAAGAPERAVEPRLDPNRRVRGMRSSFADALGVDPGIVPDIASLAQVLGLAQGGDRSALEQLAGREVSDADLRGLTGRVISDRLALAREAQSRAAAVGVPEDDSMVDAYRSLLTSFRLPEEANLDSLAKQMARLDKIRPDLVEQQVKALRDQGRDIGASELAKMKSEFDLALKRTPSISITRGGAGKERRDDIRQAWREYNDLAGRREQMFDARTAAANNAARTALENGLDGSRARERVFAEFRPRIEALEAQMLAAEGRHMDLLEKVGQGGGRAKKGPAMNEAGARETISRAFQSQPSLTFDIFKNQVQRNLERGVLTSNDAVLLFDTFRKVQSERTVDDLTRPLAR